MDACCDLRSLWWTVLWVPRRRGHRQALCRPANISNEAFSISLLLFTPNTFKLSGKGRDNNQDETVHVGALPLLESWNWA
jgi:hypothetical protein